MLVFDNLERPFLYRPEFLEDLGSPTPALPWQLIIDAVGLATI